MLPFKYTYLSGTIITLIPWLILYLHRKDVRKEMWFMSITVAIGSFVTAYFWWTIDWWRPQTITGTRVGIEDIILGFTNGGIASVLYEEVFKKKLYKRRLLSHTHTYNTRAILFFSALMFIIAILFWGLHLTSFTASTIGMILCGSAMIYVRKDLFVDAVASGFLVTIVALPFYWILIFLSPGWVEATWIFPTLSGIKFTGIPLEDIVFYLLFGFTMGPFYEYWQGTKLEKITS